MVGRCALMLIVLIGAACDRVFQTLEVDEPGDAGTDGIDAAALDASPDAAPLVGCLTDDFELPAINPNKWMVYDDPSASVAQSGGFLVITLGQATGVNYASIESPMRDMTDDVFSIELIESTNPVTNAESGLAIAMDNNHRYMILVNGTLLLFRVTDSGVNNDTWVTFDSTNHRYLRLRHAAGNMIYETSSNRMAWFVRRTVATPFAVTAVFLSVFGGTYKTETSPPGRARYDNLIVECF